MDMIEPMAEHPDPLHPEQTIKGHAAAIIQTAEDWGKLKTALEQACRELGARCSYKTWQSIKRLQEVTGDLEQRVKKAKWYRGPE